MRAKPLRYNLIHVLSSQELYTPLVLSQVFEQVASQQSQKGDSGPVHAEIWVPIPLRFLISSKFIEYRSYLRRRFKNIKIRFLPGIDRLKGYPISNQIRYYRKSLKGLPCIFHFRGDTLIKSFCFIKQFYPQDRFVVDVRGIWPAEKLLLDGIEIWKLDEIYQHATSKDIQHQLRGNLAFADGITAVSTDLVNWASSLNPDGKLNWVVPCSINFSPESTRENSLVKQSLDHENFVIGYMGGTAPYQNLEDLLFPLFKQLLEADLDILVKLITHQPKEMVALLTKSGISTERVEIVSVSQEKVKAAISILDLGFLIRKPNLVNSMAQPVKIGEYLGAGVPVCIEGDLGGLHIESSAILGVSLMANGNEVTARQIIDYLRASSRAERSQKAFETAQQNFSWNKNIHIHRENYLKLLNQN